ncbi:MAG: thiamine phosphate synthase [Cyanobacteria bacterium P01_E01_bin.34]
MSDSNVSGLASYGAAVPMAIARILDANLDRSREGLRVIEDWFRFSAEHLSVAAECKDMRQRLAFWHSPRYRAARDTPGDPGTKLHHEREARRDSLTDLLLANFSRVQEALRVLEEYAKLDTPEMAADCKHMRYRMYALESMAMVDQLRDRLKQARLYLITSQTAGWLDAVEASLQGGVRLVQYRNKTGDYRTMRAEAAALKEVCDRYGAITIINDRVDIALDIGADGVHLGQTDMPVETAREMLGPQRLIGQSTTNVEEMERALQTSADYIGVGPVYATPTKAGKAPAGLEYVRLAVENATVPWFAIGGIDTRTLSEVVEAGATHVSVVRALMAADKPAETAQAMLAILKDRPLAAR